MKYFSIFIILVFIILGIWAVIIEPNILTVKHLKFKNADLAGLKIVYASDFHIKPYERYRLKKIVKRINAQNPDLILLGGDYVNGHDGNFTMPIEDIAAELKNLKSKYGVVTVMGNHDGWQGKYRIIKALKANGIIVLENENIAFGKLSIAGVEDMQTGNPDVEKALKGIGRNVIVLSHTPDVFPLVPEYVTLTIAGHLHGGQVVFPGRPPKYIPSKYGTRYLYGIIKENGKTLYTSRGLGNSILPVRFNCLPEFVVIEFNK
ncbi:metallophosphoesterase [bacterium]|nr:metallophosphoesterase [bacterium]